MTITIRMDVNRIFIKTLECHVIKLSERKPFKYETYTIVTINC